MPESNYEPTPARAQMRNLHPMSHTTTPLIKALVAQAVQGAPLSGDAPDPVRESVQLACSRWLAGYRASQGLYVGQLIERTAISPELLLTLDTGLAWPDMLSAEQEAALRQALITDDDPDRRTLHLLLDLALGRARDVDPSMLDWLLEDLERNVWRQADIESTFTEYFSPADTREVETVHRLLTSVQLLMLQILFLGPRSSQELHDEAVRRRVWGRAGLDSATFAAVVDFLLAQGLIELLDERWDESIQRHLLYFRLTTLGLRVVALRRHIDKVSGGETPLFTRLRVWLRAQETHINTT
jgi:hypothetical protein